jgi:hypothetical protein
MAIDGQYEDVVDKVYTACNGMCNAAETRFCAHENQMHFQGGSITTTGLIQG